VEGVADIVHDRFHISQNLNEAVDKVRRKENKQLAKAGDKRLTGSKFDWLASQENLPERYSESFEVLRNSELKVALAWAIKKLFLDFWTYQAAGWAKRHFEKWYSWAIRSRLDPIKAKARMIKTHLPNILTYFKHGISNAYTESLSAKIQTFKLLRNFRAGVEGNISQLKRTFGAGKATWKGHEGFKAYVWASVISYNLTRMARMQSG